MKNTGGFISFQAPAEVDPGVQSLIEQVGGRIGEHRKSQAERKQSSKWKKKELARKRTGLVRVTVDIRPETKADLHLLASSLGVTASQVCDILLEWAMQQERESMGPGLSDLRTINNKSRRYEFILQRGTPQKLEGHPSQKQRGTPRKR
jgi:hypothetical protein